MAASITLDTLADELATEAGEQYSNVLVASQFQKWVKEGYFRVIGNARFLWQNESYDVVLSSGVSEYTLSPEVAEVKVIRDKSSNKKIGYNTEEDLAQADVDFEESGTPTYWFYSGQDTSTTALKVTFVPVPNSTLTFQVRALTRPTDLSASSTIPMPEHLVDLVRVYVRAMYMYYDGQLDAYTATMQDFTQGTQIVIARYNSRRRSESRMASRRLPRVPQAPAADQD